eukprot:s3093_g9.t4
MWGPVIFVVLLCMLTALAVMLLSEIKGLREALRRGWSAPVKTATSLFCPLSIDMLAGRLSINVTVLLSMVAFSVQRPSAIEAVPYNTIHDIFVQVI